jgi:hypothetical protein
MMKFQPLLLILATLTGFGAAVLQTDEFLEFLEQCADGNAAEVIAGLKKNPEWAKEFSPEGETCLHVAGIHGEVDVTKALLDHGVDPNLVSHMIDDPEEGAIQMHALSWHVFGGHIESAKLLLKAGAGKYNQFLHAHWIVTFILTSWCFLFHSLVNNEWIDPNLLMDSIVEENERVTVLDMLEQLLAEEKDATDDELGPFIKMKDMLVSHGAKRKQEL